MGNIVVTLAHTSIAMIGLACRVRSVRVAALLATLSAANGIALPLCAAAGEIATSANERAPATIERDVHLFVIQKDGSVEEHDDTLMRADTASGVDAIAQRYVWFNKDIEQVQLLAAETIDPDGTAHAAGTLLRMLAQRLLRDQHDAFVGAIEALGVARRVFADHRAFRNRAATVDHDLLQTATRADRDLRQ